MLSVPSHCTYRFHSPADPQPSSLVPPMTAEVATPVSLREAAMNELIAVIRATPLPRTSKLVSEERARAAALVLIRALKVDSLDLSSVTSTVSRLLQSGGNAILPLLDALCASETGRGIRSVRLDRTLTALLQADEPNGILGLQAFTDLHAVVLVPTDGELDTRLLPIARSFLLNMDAEISITVHAYIGQCLDSVWPGNPIESPVVHRYCTFSDELMKSMSLPIHLEREFRLLTRPDDPEPVEASVAHRPTESSSILGFLQERSVTPPAAQASASLLAQPAVGDQIAKLVDDECPTSACWLKVTEAGTVDALFLEALDGEPAEQATYRIDVTADDFEAALGQWMEHPGLPLPQLLRMLSHSPVDLEGFTLWLHGGFNMTRHRSMQPSITPA